MKHRKLLAVALFSLIFFGSCSDEEPELLGQFDQGFFIVNEGNFGEADGSISHVDGDGEVTQGVFASQNNGAVLGDIVQSIYHADEKFFIIVNNSNKIEVVDDENFESLYTITDVSLPRYMTHDGQTGYVAEWVSFSSEGRVTAIDLNSGEILFRVSAGFGAERPLINGDFLYITNNFASSVSKINIASQELIENIPVGNAPSAIYKYDQKILVTCNGGFDADFNPLQDGKISIIDPGTGEASDLTTFSFNLSSKAAFDASRGNLYVFSGKSVYKVNVDNPPADIQPLFTAGEVASPYGIAVHQNENVFVTDSKGFQTNGNVLEYNQEGQLQASYDAGRGPNGLLFLTK